MQKQESKKAFISLFTVLLATVILAIAVGMTTVALKQIVLTSTADQANDAFYSADSGLQCVIMLDLAGAFQVGSGSTVNCGTVEGIAVDSSDSGVFKLNGLAGGFDWENGNCVRITVNKLNGATQIESLGYNMSCEDIAQSPRSVERALRVRYGN